MTHQTTPHIALKLGTELVSATLVGGAIGYGLDKWLATTPWLMVLFLIFGIAAGFRNLYRHAMSTILPENNSKRGSQEGE